VGERESIGDLEVSQACAALTAAAARHADMAVPWKPEINATLQMIFPQDTINRAVAAQGIIMPRYAAETYKGIATGVTLSIGYEDTGVPTIDKACLDLQPSATRLLHTIEEIRGVYHKYEKVKYVLRWMNRNATPGAIRHYWPSALQLCPGSTALQGVSGGAARYSEPPEIGGMLQMIRDTAATVAALALMPDTAVPRPRTHLWLTFHPTTIMYAETDNVSINL
jgi:hypothetical protein